MNLRMRKTVGRSAQKKAPELAAGARSRRKEPFRKRRRNLQSARWAAALRLSSLRMDQSEQLPELHEPACLRPPSLRCKAAAAAAAKNLPVSSSLASEPLSACEVAHQGRCAL